jgi:hypothetical protein
MRGLSGSDSRAASLHEKNDMSKTDGAAFQSETANFVLLP